MDDRHPDADEPVPSEDEGGEDEGVMEHLRDMPVGVNDPNIIGDAGPTDVPPGSEHHDPDELTFEEEDDEGSP